MQKATRIILTRLITRNQLTRKLSQTSVLDRGSDFIIKSMLSDIVVPETPLIERVWRDVPKFANHVAIECAETGKRYTYAQLQAHTASFATSLHRLGLRAGDVVAAVIPNMPEYPVVVFGCVQAGCVLTTINPIYKEFEISHQVSTTQPKLVVTTAECYANVVKGLSRAKLQPKIVIVDQPSQAIPEGTIRFSEIAENGGADLALLDKVQRSLDDVAFIPFSSGTTGLPKGVEITYRNVLAGMEMMMHERVNYPEETTETHQDVLPGVLPFFHIYGLVVVMMGHMSQGCKIVTLTKFSTDVFFDVLKNKKSSLIYVVPPIVILLSKHPDVQCEHLRHVRYLLSGAAPLAATDVDPLFEKAGRRIKIGQGFGATETSSLTTTTLIGTHGELDLGAAGVPMSNVELLFVDPATGRPVPPGEQGELLIRGPVLMKGYHKNEQATKEAFTEDGFYRTGDLGLFKPGVGLYINDRIKELIKVKGMQVAPAELESLLRHHPAVTDAAVVGVPHSLFGETPKAFIKTKPGVTVSAEDIQEFVASRVATFKKIDIVQFVNDIPKTSSGKIMRRELKKMYA